MKIIRVFPRKTKATPDDEDVRIAEYPGLFDDADEVNISVTFTWDIPLADKLYNSWIKRIPRTFIGGPALTKGFDFIPGKFVKEGYVITSRGCPNKCWFCSVWKREGHEVRELPIHSGWNILDDNLLACSEQHIRAVFKMLSGQHRVEITGGLEAKRLLPWHVEELAKLKLSQVFFAYDTENDYEPLCSAGRLLASAEINYANRKARCYVLCGFPNDTFDSATSRMFKTVRAGFMPMAMLYRGKDGKSESDWMKWQRQWARPAIISSMMKKHEAEDSER